MCNSYSMTSNQAAISQLTKVLRDALGNLGPLPAIFVRKGKDGERELLAMR
jgi:hypothetical protein